MKVFLIKIGRMNYGICCSDSIEKVRNFYTNELHIEHTIEDITNAYDFPALEINITHKLKDLIK